MKRKIFGTIGFYSLLAIIIIVDLFPLYWMISSSLKTYDELFNPSILLPSKLFYKNYIDAIFGWEGSFFIQMKNSIILAVSTAALAMFIAIPSGYALARLTFKWKKLFMRSILFTYVVPSTFLVVPYFALMSFYKLYNTYFGVIIADTVFTLPYCVLVLMEYFRSIPKEIEESALVDGATIASIIIKIIIPLSAPALAAIATFAFLYSWNEYLYVIVLMGSSDMFTVPVGIGARIAGDTFSYGPMFAMATIYAIPSIIFYLIIERYIITGLTAGAIKG
ncbi:MAG: carbohydrate ABC transporter permease [Nitrososphaeria archaeon]